MRMHQSGAFLVSSEMTLFQLMKVRRGGPWEERDEAAAACSPARHVTHCPHLPVLSTRTPVVLGSRRSAHWCGSRAPTYCRRPCPCACELRSRQRPCISCKFLLHLTPLTRWQPWVPTPERCLRVAAKRGDTVHQAHAAAVDHKAAQCAVCLILRTLKKHCAVTCP